VMVAYMEPRSGPYDLPFDDTDGGPDLGR
jgi:hypothetical protein